ncbi:serine/threonine-protein kinase [Candidatus Margulisiibacteriota bacterium]
MITHGNINRTARIGRAASLSQSQRLAIGAHQRSAPNVANPAHQTAGLRELEIGSVFATNYQIRSLLSKDGGMSIIYDARDLRSGKDVALKITEPLFESKFNVDCLRNEAGILAQNLHPMFPAFHEVGSRGDQHFIVMEKIDGISLQAILKDRTGLTLPQVIETSLQVLYGLKVLHANNEVHRDLKPANILINKNPDGGLRARLLDFGISCKIGNREEDGTLAGSPAYISPEQIFSKRIDQRTDIYSLGLLLYEMLTRENPMSTGRVDATIANQTSKTTPDLPIGLIEGKMDRDKVDEVLDKVDALQQLLQKIVAKMSKKDPVERYQTVDELIPEFEEAKALAQELAAYEERY